MQSTSYIENKNGISIADVRCPDQQKLKSKNDLQLENQNSTSWLKVTETFAVGGVGMHMTQADGIALQMLPNVNNVVRLVTSLQCAL